MHVPGQPYGRRVLADRLRRLRGDKVSREEVARAIRRPLASYKHFETGERPIPELELYVLAQFYGLSEEEAAELEELRQRATRPSEYASFGLPEETTNYLDMEREADEIRTWQNLIIPGMLQVEPYMRRLFEGTVPASEIDQRVRARLKRQERLSEVQLTAVIAEEALIRCAKVPVQVARLAQLAEEQDNIEIRIMPLWAGLHRGMAGSFTHLALDPGYRFAYQETASGSHLVDKPSTVGFLVTLFDELRDQALDPDESLALISRLAHQR
jgi:transcriptional regulator with XRE-family HTH domain